MNMADKKIRIAENDIAIIHYPCFLSKEKLKQLNDELQRMKDNGVIIVDSRVTVTVIPKGSVLKTEGKIEAVSNPD